MVRSARLDGADMAKASLYEVDAPGPSFSAARIMGASLSRVDPRGADLTDAVVFHDGFEVSTTTRRRVA
ncbi:hypothetical protein [Streptomyces sp. NPDC056670]|uniref:hypothetical protein n=1 Tax=Streptomyces sp. NPDC056670 TaxID=3345904 RepID=UPI0036755F96